LFVLRIRKSRGLMKVIGVKGGLEDLIGENGKKANTESTAEKHKAIWSCFTLSGGECPFRCRKKGRICFKENLLGRCVLRGFVEGKAGPCPEVRPR